MRRLTFLILEIVFYALLPALIIFLQYNTIQSDGVKVGMTCLVMICVVFVLFKKFYVDKKLQDMNVELINYKSDYKTETDAGRKEKIKKAMRMIKLIMAIYNAVIPILLLGAAWAVVYGLEAQLVQLSKAVKYVLLSYIAGGCVSVIKVEYEFK